MKKISLIALSAITLGFATPSDALFYGSIGLASTMDTEINTTETGDAGMGYAVAVGVKVPMLPVRAEIESFNFNGADFGGAGTDIKMDGLMLNVYAGLPIPVVSPYIGVGIGMANTTVRDTETGVAFTSDNEAAYNVMVGADLDIPLLPVGLSLEYRYTSINSGEVFTDDTVAQSVLLKARLAF